MARKTEVGISYFPMNTDIIHNPKVKLVVAEFGSKTTWAVLLPLYCKIYREKGYWVDWYDEDSKLLFAQDECRVELSVVNELVNGCIRRSLFNKGVFETFGVLTSDRIQENYFEATKRYEKIEVFEELLLIDDKKYINRINVNILPINVSILTKKVNINSQKKILDKKEKESEIKNLNTHTQEEIELFKKFKDWIKKNAPRVEEMKEPISIEQFFKLKQKLSNKIVQDLLIAMQNYKPLHQKSISAYLTILNWSKKEDSNEPSTTQQSSINEALKSAGKTEIIH
jgi:hypothetical protein